MMADDDVRLIAPVAPHEMDRELRRGLDLLVAKIAAESAVMGLGHDLLLRIYTTGLYHGSVLGERLDKSRISQSDGSGQ